MKHFKITQEDNIRLAMKYNHAQREDYKDLIIIRYISVANNRQRIIIDKPAVIMFRGKSKVAFNHFYYKDEETREIAITIQKNRTNDREASKEQHRLEKLNFKHSVTVGTIFCDSWGYDQTNVDYYQVIELIGKTSAILRKIASNTIEGSEGMMSCNVVPEADNFTGDPFTKRITLGNYIKVHSWGCGIWSGQPNYCSWYH